jgi:hypothetical protein
MAALREYRHAMGMRWREPPEVELLLCLARARIGAEENARLDALLQTGINWDAFIALAERQRLLPLCTHHLARLADGRVPVPSMQLMRRYTERNCRRSLALTGELRSILGLLATAGVPALAFKGPVLAAELYGSIALRDVLDLDILVRKQDALLARDLVVERGYRSFAPRGRRWDEYLLRTGCNFPVVHEDTGHIVELHWTPEAGLPDRTVAELWSRREYVTLAGREVATLARQDLLLLQCLHGCRHMWERLEWVVGVAEMVRSDSICWGWTLKEARSIGGRRALHLGLALAHGLLGAPLPDHVLQGIHAERGMPRIIRDACDQLFCETPTLAHQRGLHFHGFQLRCREQLRARASYLGRRCLARAGQIRLSRMSAPVMWRDRQAATPCVPSWLHSRGAEQ